jgi:ABC-2 type transport system permease protein
VTRLTGTGTLLRLGLRRDRVRLAVWVVAIGGLTAAVGTSVVGLYVTADDRATAAAFNAANAVSRAFDGPASGPQLGSLVVTEVFAIIAVLAAILAIQTVVRHTRAEEEAGRTELVGSGVVGRDAPLAAAMIVASGATLAVGAAFAVALLATGLPTRGSVLAGAALAGVGLSFAAVAAVTAQVLSTARGATGAAMATLAAAFVLRAAGDAAGTVAGDGTRLVSAWPSWLSPIGWGQQVRPFADAHLDVLLLPLATLVVLVGSAVALTAHRDVGSGLVAPHPGPATASRALSSGLGLAWRLQRGTILAWCTGLAVIGAGFGFVGDAVDDVVADNPQMADLLAGFGDVEGLRGAFFAFTVGFLVVAAAAVPVQLLLRARAEEASGRLEPLLATSLSRTRWLAGHLAVAGGATLAALVVFGVAGGIGYGAATGDWATGTEGMLGGALVHLPAVLVLAGVTLAAIALAPRAAPAIAWSALAASFVLGQLGALLELPQPLIALSPFSHVPAVPAEAFAATPVVVLSVVAVTLLGVGVAAFRRRDLVAVA